MTKQTGGGSPKYATQREITAIYTLITCLVGVFLTIVGWRISVSAAMEEKIERITTTYTEIQTRLASIETNILWIKGRLNY